MKNADDEFVKLPEQDPDEVISYWTEERMKNAIPLNGSLNTQSGQENGATIYRADVKENPFNCVGKLFFAKEVAPNKFENNSCSAFFALSNSTLMTAAHCILTPSAPQPLINRHFLFILQYGGGSAPLTCVPQIPCLYKKYFSESDEVPNYAYDFAFFSKYVPTLGFMEPPFLPLELDTSSDSAISQIGYLSKPGMEGMYYYKGKKVNENPVPGLVEMSDRLGPGSSGGPWCQFLPGGPTMMEFKAVGLTSHPGYTFNNTYSPIFNEATVSLYDFAKRQ